MNKSWEKLWEILKSESQFHGSGMPDYKLSYHPYEATWKMEVSYSDSTICVGIAETEYLAIEKCYTELRRMPYKFNGSLFQKEPLRA